MTFFGCWLQINVRSFNAVESRKLKLIATELKVKTRPDSKPKCCSQKNQLAHPQSADSHGKPKEYGFLTPARVKYSVQVSGYFQLNFERTLEIEEVKSLNGHLSG